MVLIYTFSVVVLVVVVVGVGGGAGVKEEGEAVVGAVRCGRRGVGDGSEGVEIGQRGGAATVGEAVGGERREVDGLGAGEVAAVVEVGRREVEVGGEVADQDEVVPPGQLTVQWAGKLEAALHDRE